VIIVAVTIAVAIAVAFWMTGIVGLFTGFEQIQIISAVPTFDNDNNRFTITLTVRNTGTAAASVDNLFINGVPFDNPINVQWDNNNWDPGTARTLAPGQQVQITITFDDQTAWAGGTLTHGVSVEIKLHTASGKEYPKLVVLP
jgi:archaellum component FlaG (FlaF/FlaG flagellin family)